MTPQDFFVADKAASFGWLQLSSKAEAEQSSHTLRTVYEPWCRLNTKTADPLQGRLSGIDE